MVITRKLLRVSAATTETVLAAPGVPGAPTAVQGLLAREVELTSGATKPRAPAVTRAWPRPTGHTSILPKRPRTRGGGRATPQEPREIGHPRPAAGEA